MAMPEEQGSELVAEWGERQANGDVYIYQQFANGSVVLDRIESWGQNQGVVAPTVISPTAYPTITDPNDITPWWQQWIASGGSGDPNEFVAHYQTLFGQTPDMGVVNSLAAGMGKTAPKPPTTPKPPTGPTMNLAGNYLEALMANEAARLGMERSRGGFADWMSLTQAPFSAGVTRSNLLNQIAQTMGWWPNKPSRFGVPEVPSYVPPSWLNDWIQQGYAGGNR